MATYLLPPEELDKLSIMDPEFADFAKREMPEELKPTPDKDPAQIIHAMRAIVEKMPKPPPVPEVRESQSTYTTRDGKKLRLCIFRPAGMKDEKLPLLVFYHGGGHCFGTPESNVTFARVAVIEQHCVVVAVQYRLAPERKFPTQVEDSWDALKHIASHSEDFGADAHAGLVIGGESAGAVIASVLALQARDEPLNPGVTGVYLAAGSYFNPANIPEQYKQHYRSSTDAACMSGPLLSKDMKSLFAKCLQGDFTSPMFKAALWLSGHAGLPKTYLQTCGMDMNRDEGFLYADMLQKAGVDVKLDVYPGAPHCFWRSLPHVQQAMKWREDTKEGLRWLFSQ